MAECVDQEARDRIAKLWTAHEQHATDYWGPDKANGKRSELVDISKRLDPIETEWTHFQDTKEATCIGLKALNGHLDAIKEREDEMVVEREKGKTLMRMQWIQFAALIAVALIGLLK